MWRRCAHRHSSINRSTGCDARTCAILRSQSARTSGRMRSLSHGMWRVSPLGVLRVCPRRQQANWPLKTEFLRCHIMQKLSNMSYVVAYEGEWTTRGRFGMSIACTPGITSPSMG